MGRTYFLSLFALVLYFVNTHAIVHSKGEGTTEPTNDETTARRYFDGYYYVDDTIHFYKVHNIKQSFENAKETCKREGATMFYPENHQEIKAVINHWINYLNFTFPQYLLLGLKRPKDELTMLRRGTAVDSMYHNWNPNLAKNTGGNENCMQITYIQLPDRSHFIIWVHTATCKDKHYFMCKKTVE